MFCTQCGTKLPDDARFCTNCGASVAPKTATQAPAPAETQAAEPAPAEAPAVDPGETVVTLDAVEPTSEPAPAPETVTDPGETVVTLDAVDADPGETVVTLDAVEPSANAEAEASTPAPVDPGETVVTLDAADPESAAPTDTAEPQADQTDPGKTIVTLDAVEPASEPSDEQTTEPQPAAGPEPAAEPVVIDDAAPVDVAEANKIFEDEDNAAVAVAFPGDDAAEPAAVADDPTTLVNVNDDPTTIAEFDEDAQATAEAMESLGVAQPTAGATVVDLPQQQMTDTTMQAAPIPQPQPQPQMPMPQQPQQKKRRWPVFAGLGLVAAGAAVAAILLLTPNANAVEITSGSQDAVVCTVDTKVLPKKKDRVIHSYTATLTPKNGGKSYKIKVKGDDGFTIGDFGKVKPGDYSCKIEDTKGNTVQNFNTTVVKKNDASAEKPAESVTVNTPKKDDDASTSTDSGKSSDTTSKDDTSDDTSKDDSTTEDDSSTSSDSTSSSKPSKSNKKTDTSKDTTNTTAPATIDDATYKAACTAYKSKLNSLIKKYGEPELVSTGTSDYQISGVQFAQLVDFNGDGLEELVTVHSKTKAKSFNKKTRLSNGDYVLDVWGYNGKKVVNLYSGSPEASNGGYVFVTFKTMIGDSSNHVYLTQLMSDDTAVLVDDDAEYKYFTYDGTEFKAAEGELHGDNFNYQSAFLIKGYSDNLEDQDTSAPEGAIDTSKLNLNNTVDTVEQTLMTLTTKISGTDTATDASDSKSTDSSSSKSSSSKKSSKSSSSSKSYSYDDSDDDYDSDYDDSYDDSSDNDDSYDDSTDSVPPTEFTDVDE